MSRRLSRIVGGGMLVATAWLAVGCHADADDPAGQAQELDDPVRRQNAVYNITRLYTAALARHDGDRAQEEVRAIADATVEPLVQTYVDHPEDSQNGEDIIKLLAEMRDVRALPAFLKALEWRSGVNERHATRAAQMLRTLDVPADKRAQVVGELAKALERVSGTRSEDNLMRIEFVRALGGIGDRAATPILTRIATAQSDEQDFRINRLAAEQLGRLQDEKAVPAMIRGLFLFAPNNPAMRMNDVAAEALVRIGRPSYEPLLQVLAGKCKECNRVAQQYIAAVRQRNAQAAEQMSVEMITNAEATFALGSLGFPEALAPIIKETQSEDSSRAMQSAVALVRLHLTPAQFPQVRDTLKQVYQRLDEPLRPQLIAAMRHLYDAELQPFFLEQASNRQLYPPVRVEAARAFSLLANKQEARQLHAMIRREPSAAAARNAGDREAFGEMIPALEAATACDQAIPCWAGKLSDKDPGIARKAAYALGRFGRGKQPAVDALVAHLDHSEITVRLAVLTALDRIATKGSEAAVKKIDELRETEEGRSIWTNFRVEALPIQARLRNRS